jgi:hypothetical protein
VIIVGAGLSGLLAGALDRRASIIEAQPSLPNNHHAVLRFREDKIGKALNIPFRKVRVSKAIADEYGVYNHVLPKHANQYSKKVAGKIISRSIGDLTTAERYIAPRDFIAQLADLCYGRIAYGTALTKEFLSSNENIISTIPMPTMLALLGEKIDGSGEHNAFHSSQIRVEKYRVIDADVFQTIYFPAPNCSVYRASITGDELMIEMVKGLKQESWEFSAVLRAFGITSGDVVQVASKEQTLGKIVPLPEDIRKSTLLNLTTKHNVYSLGRFATWRNVLMDDVYDDYFKVRRLMKIKNGYDLWSAIT